ncbi:MAG: Rieske 2Fe-2S domain-containing protein [Acidobacteriota bacterium]|nr:Rieske 2Fe-2S domain-containing protein [Acidobacteriota bacterium]
MTDEENNGARENEEAESPQVVDRRRFLSRLSIAAGTVAGIIVAVPSVAFLLGLRKPPHTWRSVGKVQDFEVGSTVEVSFLDPSPQSWSGVTAKTAAWLRRESEQEFVAFSIVCTHLGCPVRWLPEARLFMCPCHGGIYYANGNVASGPPPRPLPRYPVRIQNGDVQILTSPVPITTS